MFRNYLKVALRNIRRNKLFSGINILGLAVGMACSIFILLWVQHERSYDKIHKNGDVQHVTFALTTPSSRSSWWWTGVEHHGLMNGKQQWREQFIDTNYFSFFNIPIVAGNPFRAADTANAVAMINEQAAHDMGYAEAEKAIGQLVTINNEKYTVTGIVKN